MHAKSMYVCMKKSCIYRGAGAICGITWKEEREERNINLKGRNCSIK